MKKILLIGDSIRGGYDKSVKHALKDTCDVYYPAENCRFAQYVLRFLSEWKSNLKLGDDVDVVHWNVGLWDTLVMFNDGFLTPPEFYEYFIDKICGRIKLLFPRAKVIFATSTPVVESRFDPSYSYRKNADVEKFNAIAVKKALEHGFLINDLYSKVKDVPESYYSDMTHLYTPEGTQLLTDAVIKAIGEALGVEFDEFTLTNYEEVKEVLGH